MKVITCASYYGTGSSAVTDLLSEFESVYSMTDYEFRFLHDIDGVADLEYYLVDNHNRHNSGHALKRFKKLSDFNAGTKFNKRYEPFFNYKYKKITDEYIDSLVDFSYKGYWFYDFYDRGKLFYYWKLLPGKILRKLHVGNREGTLVNVLPKEITYCSKPDREKFIQCTKEYVDKLMTAANKDKKEYLMVDQIVPPSNVSRYTKFFDWIKVVVVERDPRDVFILSKYIWKDPIVPTESIEDFCKWYKYTRAHRKTEVFDATTTKLVKFEDLVYKYENTKEDLISWIGLDIKDHTNPRNGFNPNISINNTKLWERFPQYLTEAKMIAQMLPEYLYDYSDIE